MKNFIELKIKRPELAEILETLTREELLDHYALEVEDKEDLENQLSDENDLEHIINLGINWLKKNRKDKHHIYIDREVAKLVYTNTKQKFI